MVAALVVAYPLDDAEVECDVACSPDGFWVEVCLFGPRTHGDGSVVGCDGVRERIKSGAEAAQPNASYCQISSGVFQVALWDGFIDRLV